MLGQFEFKENPEHTMDIWSLIGALDDETSIDEEADEIKRWRMTYDGYDFHGNMHEFKKMDREGHQGKAILQKRWKST